MIRAGLIAMVFLIACSSGGKDGAPAMTSSSGGSGGGVAAAGASGSGTGGSRAGSGGSGAGSGGMHAATDAGAGGAGGMHAGGSGGGSASDDAGTQDAGAVADAATNNPASCPATYAELMDTPNGCSTNLACAYPEGFCSCVGWCSGVPPDPKLPPPKAAWTCAKPAPGCPIGIPEPEAACKNEGAACFYGSCCVQNATCKSGAWTVGPPMCPP